jgi:hypothetical protein
MNYYVNFKGNVRLTRIMMNGYRKHGYPGSGLWCDIQHLLTKNLLERELPIVQVIVDTWRESQSERNVAFKQCLLRTTFEGYPLIERATTLEMSREMRQCLIEAGFTHEGTSNLYSPIIIVIDHRKWAFEDVKLLIRKGHDVNKSYGSQHLPFQEALAYHRYDIAKLFLLGGAKPMLTISSFFCTLTHTQFRVETVYWLITFNILQSAALGEYRILLFLLKNYTSAKRDYYFNDYRNLILLILDKIAIFCNKCRRTLLDNQHDGGILLKIHAIMYEPDSLMNICRKRLHRHYTCHLHRFINILLDEAFPKSITDYLQCKDMLLKYFRAEDIEALDNSLAGITLKDCTFS